MKTVITYGVFDLFHNGHERLLERAKQLGDRLIVGVTTDQYAIERGKLCVVDSLQTRMEHVRSCPWVDEVIVEDHPGQKAEDIRHFEGLLKINPNFVCWIYIPGCDISYPIVKGTDNEGYLHTTFEGNNSKSGCLFMDYR